jgi:hypothetical protein
VSAVQQVEGGTHLPATILWPGLIAAGSDHITSVSSPVDCFPTVCEWSGITSGLDQMDGENITDLLIGFPCCRTITLCWLWRVNVIGTSEHKPSGLARKEAHGNQ